MSKSWLHGQSQRWQGHRASALVFFGALLTGPALLAACGSSGDSKSGSGSGSGGSSGTTFNLGGSAASSTGSTGSGATAGGSGCGTAPLCGGATYEPEARELDMHIMMDRSGSMIGIPTGPNLWVPVGSALGNFVTMPEAAGISAGIGFFPTPDDTSVWCNVDPNYTTPAAGIGLLPGNGPAIQTAIQNNAPLGDLTFYITQAAAGNTPTLPAMQGAMQYAKTWATQNPAHKVIVVLATDGAPNICNSTIQAVAQVMSDGLATEPSVQTFVIGIGNVAGLDTLAQAGGSGKALIVDADPNVASQQFLDHMNTIRGLALPCDYGVPVQAQSDPTNVNLYFTDKNTCTTVLVGNSTDANGCNPTQGGWYYDDPANPTRIYTCPATCDLIRANSTHAKMDIDVGCTTQVVPPA